MSATLLMLVLAAPPGECDWTFSKKPAQLAAPKVQPATAQPTQRILIGESRAGPDGTQATVCQCANCDCQNCLCDAGRRAQALQTRPATVSAISAPFAVPQAAPPAYLPPVYYSPPQPVYQQPRYYTAPPVYYQPSQFIPQRQGGCPGGVCPLPGG